MSHEQDETTFPIVNKPQGALESSHEVTGEAEEDAGTGATTVQEEGEDSSEPSRQNATHPSQEIPTGRFGRFFRLSALSAGTSTRYLGQKVKGIFQSQEARAKSMLAAHRKTAEKTVDVMGQLKGAVMKVGQMVSLHPDNGILPAELTHAFAKLQSQAPTLPYQSIRTQIERELGRTPEEAFAWFDEEPMAAASLGQVHAARLPSGQEVAVKIQYPDIDKTVESDLWQLRKLLDTTGLIGRKSEADIIFSELHERLKEELDYKKEANNIEMFREFFRDEPALQVPRYFPEVSSQRVLTMERLEGHGFDEILQRHPEQNWRNRLGGTLYHLLLTQMLIFRHLHADPQLGNYLFLDDGRIVMFDFGCVKIFSDNFLDSYVPLIEAAVARNKDEISHYLAVLGMLEPGNEPALEVVLEFCDIVIEPLRNSPFRFSNDGRIVHRLRAMAPKFLAHPEIQVHPDLIYLHRTFVGLYFILTKLEAKQDWWAIFCQHRKRFHLSAPTPEYLREET